MRFDPAGLQQHLKEGETLTAIYHARGGVAWCATSERLIRYRRDRFETHLAEAPLDDLREIRLLKRTNVRMMGAGALVFTVGLVFLSLSLFTGFFPFAMLGMIIGGGLFAYGYLKDTYVYQFLGDDLDEEEWQLEETGKAARFFVGSIRKLKGWGE